MSFKFGKSSEKKLVGVDEKLVRVVRKALTLTPYDIGITCGLRTLEEQREALNSGASTTMKSRHLPNSNSESEAIDFVLYINGSVVWDDSGAYRKVMQAFVTAAIEEGVQIELGGLWSSFIDSCHVQLKRVCYV